MSQSALQDPLGRVTPNEVPKLAPLVGPRALERGVDTWRLIRYLDDDKDFDRVAAAMGDRYMLADRPGGHVVGFMPAFRLLWAEGHPAPGRLAHPDELPTAERQLWQEVAQIVPIGRDGGVGRVDGTVTLDFGSRSVGHAFLAGVAALDFPRSKPIVYGKPPETIYIAGERSGARLARIYDTGLLRGTAPPGEHLRFENQARYPRELRRHVAEVDLAHVTERFAGRFNAMQKASQGVRVQSLPVLAVTVADRIRSGEMTLREGERALGFLALHQAGERSYPTRTMMRRRAELRAAGLVVADEFYEPVDVDLAEGLDAALAAWSA